MKIKASLYSCLFICLTAFLLQSCSPDDEDCPELGPPVVNIDNIEYDCFRCNQVKEIFVVLSEPPTFGSAETDVEDYFYSNIEIAGIDEIEEGTIALRLIILDSGKPCLSTVTGIDVPFESLLGFDILIENMPDWEPGIHREEPIFAYYSFVIQIVNGEIVE